MIDEAEIWTVKYKCMRKAEMIIFKWSMGVTCLDRTRNEVIRRKIKVTEVSKKVSSLDNFREERIIIYM